MNRYASRLVAMARRWSGKEAGDRTLDAELESFLQHEIDARIDRGMTPDEARRTALASIGGIQQVKEEVRDARAGATLEAWWRDARYATRTVRRSPGLSLAVVGSLTVGIAVTIVAYAFLNAWLFRPLPGVADQARLMTLDLRRGARIDGIGNPMRSPDDYDALRGSVSTLADVAATSYRQVALQVPEPHSVWAVLVSGNYFDVLGARPALGRTFHPDEARSSNAAVAVVSHSFWRRALHGDPDVVGRTIRVGGELVQLVGVAPPGFAGTATDGIGAVGPDIWLPLALADRVAQDAVAVLRANVLQFVARMKPGVEPEALLAAASSLASNRAVEMGSNVGWASVDGVGPDPSFRVMRIAVVMSIPVLVLVVACVNAASLMLARGSRQRREVAIRLALGAARGRVIRQLLIESLFLSVGAAIVALPLASLSLTAASTRLGLFMPIDAAVLAWTLLTVLVSAVLSGVMPAFRVTARAPLQALSVSRAATEATPSESRGSRGLVAAQIALSLGALVVATQFVALVDGQGATGGTPADRLFLASFDLEQLRFHPDESATFYDRLLDAASRLPDAEAAGLARPTAVWTFGRGKGPGSVLAWAPGREAEVIVGGYAGGNLFDALGLRVLEGRAFTGADRLGPPRVAVVNLAYANTFPDRKAIGRTIRVATWRRQSDAEAQAESREVTIVGIVESAGERRYTQDGSPVGKIYVPAPLSAEPALTLYVRSRGTADSLAPMIREAVTRIDPRVPVMEMGSLASFNERSMDLLPWVSRVSALLGVIALLLAAAGLFATASYAVTLRAREFAVRLALGAEPRRLLTLVLKQSFRTVSSGFVIGGTIAVIISGLIAAQFPGAERLDLQAFITSCAVLLGVMLVASILPAVRAARVDPVANLKEG
jgi:predicted permease